MAADGAFPNWVMLERFVFRRDGEVSFPDYCKSHIWASGTTSWNLHFRVALCFAEPPLISRFYAQLPGVPYRPEYVPVVIMGTHRHLLLFRVAAKVPTLGLVQNLFIYSSHNPSSLQLLPPCTEPDMDYRGDDRLSRSSSSRRSQQVAKPRVLTIRSMGLLCRGEHEFAVAELMLHIPNCKKVFADIYVFRFTSTDVGGKGDSTTSTSTSSSSSDIGGKWTSMRLPVLDANSPKDVWQLCLWHTNTVIPFHHWLCWVDYYRGILLFDVFKEYPTVSFLQLPLDKFPTSPICSDTPSWLYRGVSAIDGGSVLMFVDVARNDGIGYGALKPGASFTITCHTLKFDSKVWSKEYTLTSDELWSANPDRGLPHDILMFPQVDIDRPHVVHFLISDYKYVMKKMWVVAIDMETKTMESLHQYANGREDNNTADADLTGEKSRSPMSFLPCEVSKFLQSSRKRKVME